jgi:glycosyltransferase involved in cell wall biosynthesis
MAATKPTQLIVCSDDWGRHPSSCQHLVGHLLSEQSTLWVNTIGMRRPRLTLSDIGKAATKLKQWASPQSANAALPDNLRVISPRMVPGFRRPWQRRINARSIAAAVKRALDAGEPGAGGQRVVLTTLPITADLVDMIEADRWVYYCVDDFSVWPGLDSNVMQEMEEQLVEKVDSIVCVSETLQQRIKQMGRDATLLTHGVDLDHWSSPAETAAMPPWWNQQRQPIFLFWGLIDRRLDATWCAALSTALAQRQGTLVLVGPQQSPDPVISQLGNVILPGPVSYEQLPVIAAAADVLVMPYIDAAVTAAMAPLKFKEYLATGKAVVARYLPATHSWADAADLVADADQFVAAALKRAETGIMPQQEAVRGWLVAESWSEKAIQLGDILQAPTS